MLLIFYSLLFGTVKESRHSEKVLIYLYYILAIAQENKIKDVWQEATKQEMKISVSE